ncbi:MAG: urease accessory protein [Rhodoglobus sp.]|nr:urease accessory protein [Rhodoglobus sp.]
MFTAAGRSAQPSPATLAMMLADARLPVGGHVHSGGLEPALRAGMPVSDVPEYLIGRAGTTSLVEAGTAVVARHAVLAAGSDSWQLRSALADVERAWAARTPSRTMREVSRALARGYVRFARTLWAQHPGVAECESTPGGVARPIILGVLAAAAGIDAAGLVRLVVYDDAQSVAAAMLKLEPLDPAIPAGWVLAACASAEPSIDSLAALTSPDAIPASGAPQSEEWAEVHSRTTQRLFRA